LSDQKYEVDVEFTLQSNEDKSHGMAVMLTHEKPKFPEEFHDEFGYRTDFYGLGVFLYRSEYKNKWVSNLISFKKQSLLNISLSNQIVHHSSSKQRSQLCSEGQKPGRLNRPKMVL
jgi:hypothetical protein